MPIREFDRDRVTLLLLWGCEEVWATWIILSKELALSSEFISLSSIRAVWSSTPISATAKSMLSSYSSLAQEIVLLASCLPTLFEVFCFSSSLVKNYIFYFASESSSCIPSFAIGSPSTFRKFITPLISEPILLSHSLSFLEVFIVTSNHLVLNRLLPTLSFDASDLASTTLSEGELFSDFGDLSSIAIGFEDL